MIIYMVVMWNAVALCEVIVVVVVMVMMVVMCNVVAL